MRILALFLLLFATSAQAGEGLLSAHFMLPVTISGEELSLESFVVRPDRPGRFPLVVITHGMPGISGDAFFSEILNRGPVGYSKAAIAFAQRGYAVVSIMRRGYGRSGGGFSERMRQACDYLPPVRAAGEDVIAAVTALRKEPWVDPDHIVLLGHSVGGLAVTAAGAQNPQGIVGVIDFDGGWHTVDASGQPCAPDKLVDMMGTLGRMAHVPALWLYAGNDQFYGPDLARRMFAAYTAGGAPARLNILAPFGTNGHDTVVLAPSEDWFPVVEPFLGGLSLPTSPVIKPPFFAELPASPGRIPACQEAFSRYLANPDDAKAYAIDRKGHGCGTGAGRTTAEASENALTVCKINTRGGDCELYAVGQELAGD